jgi:hypothetical protein
LRIFKIATRLLELAGVSLTVAMHDNKNKSTTVDNEKKTGICKERC